MATFKACVRVQRNDGLFAVLIRVTHNRVAKYIKTNKTVHKSKLRRGEIKDVEILSYCSNLIKLYSERLNAVDCSTWNVHEVVDYLPNKLKKQLADKEAKFYIINANKLANEIGMGRRTNTILQSAFFALNLAIISPE